MPQNKQTNFIAFLVFLIIVLFIGYKAYQDSLIEYPIKDLGFEIEVTDAQ